MFQALRNFTSSLKTSNANFALISEVLTTAQLERNTGPYRIENILLVLFSNFGRTICYAAEIVFLCVFCDLIYILFVKRPL